MPKLIKDGVVTQSEFDLLPLEATEAPATAALVPLALYVGNSDLQARTDIGVIMQSTDDLAALTALDLSRLPVIALHFPTFMDGRHFSHARLLRERHGYQGELRAVGYFMRDQLCYLRRCGVNAFQPADDSIVLEEAVQSLTDFTESYQTSVDQPVPLFRRRA